jgi:septal ring factor EnvC (AmiA/AmiB activator)
MGFIATLMISLMTHSQDSVPISEQSIQDISQAKSQLSASEIRQRKLLSELYFANKRMKQLVQESSNLEQERMSVESVNRDLQSKIDDVTQKVKDQKNLLRSRLSAIYKFGGQGLARFLLSSQSSSDLERNLKILGLISSRDFNLIKEYSSSVAELETKQKRLNARIEKLKSLEKSIKIKEENLEAENRYRMKFLAAIKNSKNFNLAKLREFKRKYENDSGALDLLFKPTLFDFKGKLIWPISGSVVKKFGLLEDKEYGVATRNHGVFIEGKTSAEVKSIFEGRIAFEGDINGFGRTIIIDHGDHFYSVYANLDSVAVNQEGVVKAGETIAKAGFDPIDKKSGLYFELRHFSEPYDPSKWMKGSDL